MSQGTLRLYGDSFLAPAIGWEGKSWTTLLGEQLDIPVVNKSRAGSGTEYAFMQLANDIQHNVIQQKDIIIFNTSFNGRLDLEFQLTTRPETAALYLRKPEEFDKLNNSENSNNHNWFHTNKEHIKWYVAHRDYNLIKLNYLAYVCTLKDYAATMPDTIFVILHNLTPSCSIPGRLPLDNFLNPTISLQQISNGELTGSKSIDWEQGFGSRYGSFVKHIGQDPRINHLSTPNLNILKDLVFNSINDLTISNFGYDKFKTELFDSLESIEDYKRYVDLGYLNYHPATEKKLLNLRT